MPASAHFIHETLNVVGTTATAEQVLPDAEQIGRRIDAARAGSHRRPVLVVACDGADWIWEVFWEHFPQGEQILDYYHCAEQVYDTARAQYGEARWRRRSGQRRG